MNEDKFRNFPDPDNDEFETRREQNYAQIIRELLSCLVGLNSAVGNYMHGKTVPMEEANKIMISNAGMEALASITDSEYDLENRELTDTIVKRTEKELERIQEEVEAMQNKIKADYQT